MSQGMRIALAPATFPTGRSKSVGNELSLEVGIPARENIVTARNEVAAIAELEMFGR
jgi:hypothetical protein